MGMPAALRGFLDAVARNATLAAIPDADPADADAAAAAKAAVAKQSFAFFHDALDPGLALDRARRRFVVLPAVSDDTAEELLPWTGLATPLPWSASRLWAESNWDNDIGLDLYRTEDGDVVIMTAIGGAITAVVGFFVVVWVRRCARRMYKET